MKSEKTIISVVGNMVGAAIGYALVAFLVTWLIVAFLIPYAGLTTEGAWILLISAAASAGIAGAAVEFQKQMENR